MNRKLGAGRRHRDNAIDLETTMHPLTALLLRSQRDFLIK